MTNNDNSRFISHIIHFAFVLATLMLIANAQAQLSPGELHKSHEFLEGVENCGKCHSSDRSLSTQCLGCHTAIKIRKDARTGLHGRSDYQECELCHVEHQGRDFELIYFKGGERAFDHDATGYLLQSSHAELDCRKCHRPEHLLNSDALAKQTVAINRTFLGLKTDCLSCHLDQHREKLGSDCGNCHGFDKWKTAGNFNHEQTDFALTGRHMKVECAKCHPTVVDDMISGSPTYMQFSPVKHNNCTDCHEDTHKGRFGNNCTDCHSTVGWREIYSTRFDHDKTHYPLVGSHTSVKCQECHTNRSETKRLSYGNCLDCHSDYHDRAFADRKQGGACEECHSVQGFKTASFRLAQHDETDYPLLGAHRAIACSQCHRVEKGNSYHHVFDISQTNCNDCHRDPHKKQVEKWVNSDGCEGCHTVRAWDESIFDHDKTEFALTGKHVKADCKICHNGGSLKKSGAISFTSISKQCDGCHNDIHKGQFAGQDDNKIDNCDRCHTSDNWIPTRFDHSQYSSFVLDGAHVRVACKSCHKREELKNDYLSFVSYKPLDTACVSCHSDGNVVGKAKL